MVDEDFVMGYAVGFNDGVGSGGSGVSLDDYPVFPKKFRFGDSDFYFLVGNINTGFYDALNAVNYDKTGGAYTLKNAIWFRNWCIILCKGNERFGAFRLPCDTPTTSRYPISAEHYSETTYYLDDVSCTKITPSSETGEWRYNMSFECHYNQIYSDGSYSYTGTNTFMGDVYRDLYLNADGTVNRAPSNFIYNEGTFHCFNDGYYAELMNLMLTVPDIIEEVF